MFSNYFIIWSKAVTLLQNISDNIAFLSPAHEVGAGVIAGVEITQCDPLDKRDSEIQI